MPVLALYATGKPLSWNRDSVSAHVKSCVDEIRGLELADVVVAGIRPVSQDDDSELWAVMEAIVEKKGGRKLYVGPDSDDCQKFRDLGFLSREQNIKEWLLSLGL